MIRCEHCGVDAANLYVDADDHYSCFICSRQTANPETKRLPLLPREALKRLEEWENDCRD
jgi:hypothetical protein